MPAWEVVAIVIAIGVGLYLLVQGVRQPLLLVGGLIRAVLFGVVGIFLLNLVGQTVGIHISLNPITTMVVGFLGVPGMAALLIIQMWIFV